jgi:hypothetical protein
MLDTKPNLQFSDEFLHKSSNSGVALLKIHNLPCPYVLVSKEDFDAGNDGKEYWYATFRCHRDAQTYCVLRGFTIKEESERSSLDIGSNSDTICSQNE